MLEQTLYSTNVVVEDREPILYNAQGQAMVPKLGFQGPVRDTATTLANKLKMYPSLST